MWISKRSYRRWRFHIKILFHDNNSMIIPLSMDRWMVTVVSFFYLILFGLWTLAFEGYDFLEFVILSEWPRFWQILDFGWTLLNLSTKLLKTSKIYNFLILTSMTLHIQMQFPDFILKFCIFNRKTCFNIQTKCFHKSNQSIHPQQ